MNMTLTPIDAAMHPASEACRVFMAEQGYDPGMPVYRASVTPRFMAEVKALRPDVANTLQLLVGPFGVVDPRPAKQPFRVAELQVGANVLNVEYEYE